MSVRNVYHSSRAFIFAADLFTYTGVLKKSPGRLLETIMQSFVICALSHCNDSGVPSSEQLSSWKKHS